METEAQAPRTLEAVQGQYMLFTTFRKTGERVPTAVWYGRELDKLYLFSLSSAGKVNRVRNHPQVELASCTMNGTPTGPTAQATGRILPREEEAVARWALRQHYPIGFRFSEVFSNGLLRRRWTFVEISQIEDRSK
jgi:PPOX class probable F420-dependent enzyme